MQEQILFIIKYLLEKKQITNNDMSLDSFFDNGISFPTFIARVFNYPKIPGIIEKPSSKSQCEQNNEKAFHFLLENSEKIKILNPSFQKAEDRIQLLKLIITIECFPENSTIIMKKMNMFLGQFNFNISNEGDLYNFTNISLLLNSFTNGVFPKTSSFFEISHICKKCQIPFFVDEYSIEKGNFPIFLVQIQILFDFFSECSHEKLDLIKEQIQKDQFENEIEEEEEENDSDEEIFKNGLMKLDSLMKFDKLKDIREMIEEQKEMYQTWNNYKNKFGHFFLNGILGFQLNFKIKLEFNSCYDLPTPKLNIKDDSDICQLFKYDESKRRWIFNITVYEKFFSVEKKNPEISLVLLVDSDYIDIGNLFYSLGKDICGYDLGEDISVFAFRRLPKDIQDQKIFLFVHVPKSKINIENIFPLLYQIYTFLYTICNSNIVILNHKYFIFQLEFFRRLIRYSDYYKNHAKDQNGNKIFAGHSQLYYFQFMKLSDGLIKNFIKTKYEKFDNYDKILAFCRSDKYDSCYRFNELKELFMHCHRRFSEISELYVCVTLDFKFEIIPASIELLVNVLFKNYLSKNKYNKNKKLVFGDIQEASKLFYIPYDFAFSEIYESELLKKAFAEDLFDKTIYIKKLKQASENHLTYLKNIITNQGFCSQKQIDMFFRGHQKYLQKQFFEIIKSTYKGTASLLYDKLIDVFDSQITKDFERIDNFYQEFKRKANEKKPEKFIDACQRGANYVINEVETTREIVVNVESDEEFEKIIPQDF